MRLQKYMAECGIASRRASEELIKAGKLKVNGEIAELGTKVDPMHDMIEYEGKLLNGKTEELKYIVMNKPRGYITTLADELGRKCITELIPTVKERVVPVGRLDRDSEGMLLLTNDGDLIYTLTHPKHDICKYYTCVVKGFPSVEQITKLNSPMEIDGYVTSSSQITVLSKKEDRTSLRFVLREGRNRQIRKMCENVGLEVLRLKRVAIGDLRLAEVKTGKWRYLEDEEIKYLKSL